MASESSHKKNQHKPLKMIAKFFNKGKIIIRYVYFYLVTQKIEYQRNNNSM